MAEGSDSEEVRRREIESSRSHSEGFTGNLLGPRVTFRTVDAVAQLLDDLVCFEMRTCKFIIEMSANLKAPPPPQTLKAGL